jgi:hypothetical protein
MATRLPLCSGDLASSLSAMRHVTLDGVSIAQAVAGVLFGIFGLPLFPMLLLVAAWQVGAYFVACGSLLPALHEVLRPSFGDAAFVLGGWMLGRLLRAIDRRRSERRLIAEGQAAADDAWRLERASAHREAAVFESLATPDYPSAPNYEAASNYPSDYAEVPTPPESTIVDPATMLELDDHEASALRGALNARLAELRRNTDDRRNVSGDSWSAIGTLEDLLARLPA